MNLSVELVILPIAVLISLSKSGFTSKEDNALVQNKDGLDPLVVHQSGYVSGLIILFTNAL